MQTLKKKIYKKNCSLCNNEFLKRTRMSFVDWEKQSFCSKSCARIKTTPKGESAFNWLGSNIGYNSLHKWISRNFGKPKYCEFCKMVGKKNGRNWNIDWANVNSNYTRDRKDWLGLCRSCHFNFDKNKVNKKTIYIGNHKTILIHES